MFNWKYQKLAVIVLCFAIIITLNQNSMVIKAETQEITFSFDDENAWVSGSLNSSINFDDYITFSDGNASFSCQPKLGSMLLHLDLADIMNISNTSESVSKDDVIVNIDDPLGKSSTILPDLTYQDETIGNMSLNLIFNGSIFCKISSSDYIKFETQTIKWDIDTNQNVILRAANGTAEGDLVNITLSDIKYDMDIEVVAFNQNYNKEVKAYAQLYTGTPSSMKTTLVVVDPSAFSPFLWIVVAGLSISCCSVALLWFRAKQEIRGAKKSIASIKHAENAKSMKTSEDSSKHTEEVQQASDVTLRTKICKNCNAENNETAKFCRNCGMKL